MFYSFSPACPIKTLLPTLSLKPQQNPPFLPVSSSSSSILSPPNPPSKTLQIHPNPPFSPSTILTKTNPFPIFLNSGNDDDDRRHPFSVESVTCPALAYANIYFWRASNVQITVPERQERAAGISGHENELLTDWLMKRFRNAASNAGVFHELKRRRFFESPREKRKTKAQRAARILKRFRIRAGGGLAKPKIVIRRDPVEEKKRNARLAAKRLPKKKRAELRQKQKGSNRHEIPAEEKKKESYISDDDNWEFCSVELPYC